MFYETVYTHGVPGQNWLVIGNEWVRLKFVYKTEFKHISALLSHTATCRSTHTYIKL